MSFLEFDCSDRTFEEIQIFAGFQDSNLEMLNKCFKSVFMIRDQKIKVEMNDTLDTHKVEEVIDACFSIIDTQHRLNSQDVNYICSLAFKNRLKDFKAHQLQAVCKTKTGKMIYPKTIGQAILCDAMRHNEIVFATGVAGTGKTYLAVAYAVNMLKSERVEKIILTRPAVEAGESLGFLPGDMKEKVDPYLRPLYDALNEMLGLETVEKYVEKQVIEIAPLAFMRGRTLNDAVVILDEAQNATCAQMKMFLTRIGFGSKVIITGDASQKDLPRDAVSGLDVAMKVLKKIDDIGFCQLTSKDVVRHPLVQQIVQAYDAYEKKQKPERPTRRRNGGNER